MCNSFSLLIILNAILLALALNSPCACANDKFVGLYRGINQRGINQRFNFEITQKGDLYTIKTGSWVGTGFWDRTNRQYEGVFRYKNEPAGKLMKFKRGGEAYNSVGYHRIEPLGKGKYLVHWKQDVSRPREEGTYIIERIPEAEIEVENNSKVIKMPNRASVYFDRFDLCENNWCFKK